MTWAAALLALLLAGLGARVGRARRRAPPLPSPLERPPATAILLPLRDEQENAEPCLAGLLAQTTPGRVVAVDDHSSDATPEILSRLAAASGRLEVRRAPPLPAGWGGKVHALAVGAEGAAEEWLLSTDADTRHDADLAARAHAAAAEHRLDALSLAGRQETHGLGEGLLVPAVFALLDALLGDWRPAARGEADPPVANGQFLLVRRAALERIGGWAALAGRPLDDVELARALARAGFRVGFRRAGAALRVRMYRGLGAAFTGWRRNLALFVAPLGGRAWALWALLVAPPLAALAALAVGAPAAAALLWAGGAVASALGRGAAGRPGLALLYPADALLLAATLAAALADHRRGRLAPWRGRALAPTGPSEVSGAAPRDSGSSDPRSPRSRP